MQRRWVLGLVAGMVVLTAVGMLGVSAAFSPATPADTGSGAVAQTTPTGFTNTVFEITVYENSSAQWTVRHSTPLDNETEREQFHQFATRFNNETTQTYKDFVTRATRLTTIGTNVTGRQMTASLFSRRAYIKQLDSRGVVELSFIWGNFSQVTSDGIVAGDIFEGGMSIRENQRIVMVHGPNLSFVSVDPAPDSREVAGNLTASESVTWFGGENGRVFADERPQAVLRRPSAIGGGATSTPTATATGNGSAGAGDGGSGDSGAGGGDDSSTGGFGPLAFVVALVVLAAVGGTIAWYSGALSDVPSRPDADEGATLEGASPDAPTEPTEPAVPAEELLSDEDRVLSLLEDNGGRMKQVNIVEETDWSKSKVSMLLSDMEEEGDISKLRVGRENIISLKGQEPDAVGSPFDDE